MTSESPEGVEKKAAEKKPAPDKDLAASLSESEEPCPVPSAHDKVHEAHYFIHQLIDNYHDPHPFRYQLSAKKHYVDAPKRVGSRERLRGLVRASTSSNEGRL
jgi:hypothetical protein